MAVDSPLILVFALLRVGAALAMGIAAGRQGARPWFLVGQAVSDAGITLGVVAFGDRDVAVRWGGALQILLLYSAAWELVAIKVRFDLWPPQIDESSALGDGTWLILPVVWGLLAWFIPFLMGATAIESAGRADFLFTDDRLDALLAAAAGIGILIWAGRAKFEDSSKPRRELLDDRLLDLHRRRVARGVDGVETSTRDGDPVFTFLARDRQPASTLSAARRRLLFRGAGALLLLTAIWVWP